MTCNDVRPLLAAHLDEELDVVRDAEVVAHLNTCPACADAALAHAARRGVVRERATRFHAPPNFAAQILATIPLSEKSSPIAPRAHSPSRFRGFTWALPLAAGIAVAIFGGYQWGARTTRTRDLVAALTSSHVRAAMSGHLVDVESTDRHTVKPWFVGKLDFSPPVVDLAAEGFPLIGGRLDQLDGRRVAVLIYQRRLHEIDIYLEPANASLAISDTTQAGFNVVTWTKGEFHGLAISDLAPEELKSFAQLWQSKAP